MAELSLQDIISALAAADRKLVDLNRCTNALIVDTTHDLAMMREAKDRAETDRDFWQARSEVMQSQRDLRLEELSQAQAKLAEECARWDWYISHRQKPIVHRLIKRLVAECHEFVAHEWREAIDEARKKGT